MNIPFWGGGFMNTPSLGAGALHEHSFLGPGGGGWGFMNTPSGPGGGGGTS